MKNTQKSLISRVEREIKRHSLIQPGDTIIVALSGGPDSVCLFDILLRLRPTFKITIEACHYNHRMRGEESDSDEQFVKKICREQGIECHLASAPREKMFRNEEEAREARYGFFRKILDEKGRGAKIALAHNANDLSETLILRLVRGSGLRGLRGIPRRRENFIRPLLPFSRSEIEQYLSENKLPFCIDSTNQDVRYSRNFIRWRVFPLLLELNPNLPKTLTQMAESVEDDYDLIYSLGQEEFKKLLVFKSAERIELEYKPWSVLHLALQRMVIRIALEHFNLTDVTSFQMSEVSAILKKGTGKKYKLLPHSLRVELFSGKIILVREPER